MPPSGNTSASSTIGASAATASAEGHSRAGPAIAHATNASARKAPATGLASEVTSASASAGHQRPRWAASSAPSPTAAPRSKGTRQDSRAIEAPTANHSEPTRTARSGKRPRISSVNSAVATVIETAASRRGPKQGPEPGREHRVGEQVVPAVPRVVPQREPRFGEEVAAVARRREIRARRGEDHVDQPEPRRERPRGGPAQPGDHLADRNSASRSSRSGRSYHGQCPASGSSSSSACGSAAAYAAAKRAGM